MKSVWIILSGLALGGCLTSNALQYQAASEANVYHLARVRKGMSEKQVLYIMHKPYSYETFVVDDDVFDVWFYVTKPTGLDQTRMVPQNLTPLTFKNGVLVGTGYSWYYFAMKAQAEELAQDNPPPEKPKSQDVEDAEFEKTLKSATQKRVTQREAINRPKVAETEKKSSWLRAWKGSKVAAMPKSFSKLQLGMTQDEVSNQIGKPSNEETYNINGNVYDIWFYDSAPLSFKNNILIGMTSDDYERIKAKQDEVDGYTREADKMQEDESEQNFNFW